METSLLEAPCPAALLSSQDALLLLPNLHLMFAFSQRDLEALAELATFDSSTVPVPEFHKPTFPQAGADPRDACAIYPIVLPNPPAAAELKLTSEADIEVELRSILTELNVIPLAANAMVDPEMAQVLKTQINLSDEHSRLHLALKINDFERALDRSVDQEWTFPSLVQLLRSTFEDRRPQRMEHLRKITLWSACARQFYVSAESQLGPLMWPASFPIQRRVFLQFLKSGDIPRALTGKSFKDGFRAVLTQWRAWEKDQGYTFLLEFSIFHDFLMQHFPYAAFIAAHPELTRYDEFAKAAMKEAADKKIPKWRDPIPKQGWKKVLVETPEYIGSLTDGVLAMCEPSTPIRMAAILSGLQRRIFQLFAIVGMAEAGADESTPTLFFSVELSAAPTFISASQYILCHLTSILDKDNTQDELWTAYTATVVMELEYIICTLTMLVENFSNMFQGATGEKMKLPSLELVEGSGKPE
jgi:hypothetical protein